MRGLLLPCPLLVIFTCAMCGFTHQLAAQTSPSSSPKVDEQQDQPTVQLSPDGSLKVEDRHEQPVAPISPENNLKVEDHHEQPVAPSSSDSGEQIATRSDQISLGINVVQEINIAQNSTLNATYDGLFNLTVTRYQFQNLIFNDPITYASEVLATARPYSYKSLALESSIGGFFGAESFVTGTLALKGQIKGNAGYRIGITQSPLAKDYTLATSDLSTSHDSIFIDIFQNDKITMRGALLRDGTYATYERYDFAIHLPLNASEDNSRLITVSFPISYEHRAKPSALYISFMQMAEWGASLALVKKYQTEGQIEIDGSYRLVARSSFGNKSKFEQADHIKLEASGSVFHTNVWKADLFAGFDSEKGRTASEADYDKIAVGAKITGKI